MDDHEKMDKFLELNEKFKRIGGQHVIITPVVAVAALALTLPFLGIPWIFLVYAGALVLDVGTYVARMRFAEMEYEFELLMDLDDDPFVLDF